MWFKVLKADKVVDVLDKIVYIIHQKKHNILLISDMQSAQAILSSDGTHGWHIEGLYNFPPDNYTYQIEPIEKKEYNKIKLEMEV